jgi:hypothetical protein
MNMQQEAVQRSYSSCAAQISIAQAVSRRIPTAAAQDQAQVW